MKVYWIKYWRRHGCPNNRPWHCNGFHSIVFRWLGGDGLIPDTAYTLVESDGVLRTNG